MLLMGKRKITFLIGSGASIDAGMPKTNDITNAVCGFVGNYSDEDCLLSPDEKYNSTICLFMKKELSDIYKTRYGIDIEISYEDIFHVFRQVHYDEGYEYPNAPFAELFKDKYLSCFANLIEQQISDDCVIGRNIELNGHGKALVAQHDEDVGWISVADESTLFQQLERHIEDILVIALDKREVKFDEIRDFWTDVQEDGDFNRCDIFSLNHDKVLEKLFTNSVIPFNDGLTYDSDGLRYWNRNLFEQNQRKMQLYKLHGSIDWWHHDRGVVNRNSSEGKRALLIGTYMKMLEYAGPDVFQDLFHLFYRCLILEEAQNLVVIGYGFRDRGINNMIINWIYNNPTNKNMIIVAPKIDKMKAATAYLNIGKVWEKKDTAVSIDNVDKKFRCVSWEEIKRKLE